VLHIGLTIDDLGVHGAVRRFVELGNALTARGHWVTIYTQAGKPCEWLPQSAEASMLKDLETTKLNGLIYSGGSEEAYRAARGARAQTKIFYALSIPNFGVLKDPTDDYTKRVLVMLNDKDWRVACCSTAMWQDMLSVRNDALLLLGGINRSIFHRRKVRRTGDIRVVLSSGDHREREGSGDALAATKLVEKKIPGVIWNSYFKRGYTQTQIAEAYSAADVFLDAQRYAGWNNAVTEAMACGTPVVCTSIGGSRDLAEDGVTALVVPPRDVQAMADAVTILLSNEDVRVRLVVAAMERVGRFTYSAMAERVEAIIDGRI
jgi:hypothetical protein